MKVKLGNGLLLINLLIIPLVVATIFLPSDIMGSGVMRLVLGIPFLLFFPGYALLAILFPRRETISIIERVAISFGVSIGILIAIALALNYTPWGIAVESIVGSMASFIFITSLVSWLRQQRVPIEERFVIRFALGSTPAEGANIRGKAVSKTVSIIILVGIFASMGALGYTVVRPRLGERFTEFYILGAHSEIGDYPEQLPLGGEGEVIVSIVSHEREPVTYRLEVAVDGVKNNEVRPIMLEHEQKWQQAVTFSMLKAGDNQKVEFLLYKGAVSEPYRRLFLWIDVPE